jgi:hypothetical protein
VDELTHWSRLSWVTPLLAGSLAFGCGQGEDCSGIGAGPVAGELRDKSGAPICAAQIRVTATGVDESFGCHSDAGTSTGPCCTFRVLGGPGDREYTIEVTANGYAPNTTVVFVPEDECDNPVPQYVIVELSPQ